jgi:hypothetical protein
MAEILKKRLADSIGKNAKIFLKNNFCYEGKITNCDDKYIEILCYTDKSRSILSYKLIFIEDINDATIEANEEKLK